MYELCMYTWGFFDSCDVLDVFVLGFFMYVYTWTLPVWASNGSVTGCHFTIPYGLTGTVWEVQVKNSTESPPKIPCFTYR